MDTTLQVRTSKTRKEKARRVFKKLGLNLSSGVNLYLERVIATESVSFVPATPHGLKLKHWEEYKRDIAWARKHGKRYTSVDALLNDLDAD